MNNNWASTYLEQFQLPNTVDEAAGQLILILDNGQKTSLLSMQEEDLVNLHFGLGTAIRNVYKLHQLDSKLMASFGGPIHPDDVSAMIIKLLWQKLQDKSWI
ncbi:MAG: DUF6794 domain-containing protein [Methylococcales bacterium]